MTAAAFVLFWISLLVIFYVYFGYPALLFVLSRLRGRKVREGDSSPRLTFIIAAYNEEKVIGHKIENTLALDYPSEKVEILVVSNGSSDATDEIVRGYKHPRVRLISLEHPGKIEALNEGARQATGDILVFTDADFLLDSTSLKQIAQKFHDPEVGGVCGARKESKKIGGDSTGKGNGLYARWDRWQKIKESEIGSVFAADGLLYAIRRELYVPVSDPAQADDIAISARVVLQGYRLLFEPKATAWENAEVRAEEEFRRKVRVTNHSVRALLNLRAKLFTSGFYSLELLSHKLIRHFVPFFMITTFVANLHLATTSVFYAVTMAGQGTLYGLAALGALLRNHGAGQSRPLCIPYYFCFVNAAALVGILSIFRGHKSHAWATRASAPVTTKT